jgi:uncharacterized protein YecE (DUF72 family)
VETRPAERHRLLIGIAGWSYPDWRGVFYPRERRHGFSELRYAAERFDVIEINNTFYRLPERRVAASWEEQVRDLEGFVFTAKLTQDLSHGKAAPEEVPELARLFREGLEPLAAAGRLGCVLLQFPWFLRDGPEARDRIRRLAEHLYPLPLAVEVRHRSFLAEGAGAIAFFEGLGLHFVNIDLPRSRGSIPPTEITTGRLGYFRLHGRNRNTWFDPRAGRDAKYDYLYGIEELKSLLPAIERVAARAESTYVIANNHFRGQAAANAFQLIRLLGREPRVPEPTQAEFPFLAPAGAAGEEGGR